MQITISGYARISIHALLAESDAPQPPQGKSSTTISIHALLAESDRGEHHASTQQENFYPRSPCGERPLTPARMSSRLISIHALLAESDVNEIAYQRQINQFLSTLSLRRATQNCWPYRSSFTHFYPRSPCGERHNTPIKAYNIIKDFYPRSPCGERPPSMIRQPATNRFLSTLSLRRATNVCRDFAA